MNMNVSLTDELADFVKVKVQSGRYTSSSEVVQDALRLLEKHEHEEQQKLGWLQDAWRDGLDSGEASELDLDALKRVGREQLGQAKA
jgi:antitoxin ParD1/3/4